MNEHQVIAPPSLTTSTSDVSLHGQFRHFKLTIHSRQDATDTRSESYSFVLQLKDNPCKEGFLNKPANSALDQTYMANKSPLVVSLAGVSNTECEFEYKLLKSDGSPANSNMFSVSGLAF